MGRKLSEVDAIMSEKEISLPDFSPLADDIRKAVAAVAKIQADLAAAIGPCPPELLSNLITASMPTEAQLRAAASAFGAMQEQWRKQAEELQPTWVALAKDFEKFAPRLKRAAERASHVGQLGWTATMEMVPMDLVHLTEMESRSEADAYMVSWYDLNDPDQTRLESEVVGMDGLESFETLLAQCFSAFRRSEYAITIPCLVAVVERAIRNLGPVDHFFSTEVVKTVERRYRKIDPNSIEAEIWLTLFGFVRWFYEHYGPIQTGADRVFRHGIQHGTQPPPNDRVEALRLLNVLKTIAGLQWIGAAR